MPAIAREPSGTFVDVLCGQPEQNHGLRSASTRGFASARSFASITAMRVAIHARTSGGRSNLSSRVAIAFAMMAGDSS